MPRSASVGESDVFFDACSSTKGSSSIVVSATDEVSASWRPDYELWTSEPMSVQERRHRFLKGMMGFVEPIPTGIDFPRWQVETTADCSCHDLKERISSICSSFRSAFSEDVSVPDSACLIRVPDTTNRFAVHEEVESDKMRTSNELGSLFGFSQLVQNTRKGFKSLWGSFTRKKKCPARTCKHDVHVKNMKTSTLLSRIKVHHQNKKWLDFSAVYMCQEIQAHDGLIKVMKFSPSGWYLASGGGDSVVRIWMVREVDSSPDMRGRDTPLGYMNRSIGLRRKPRKGRSRAIAILPKKVFNITETPLHEFHGHASDILDMTWSMSEFLLTSSKDKTVRMWKVGCDGCLAVFKHRDYVTCVEFNPVDERYFVSGSIDGKVRVWDVSDNRVIDWADAHGIITAISYQADGKGFVVGTVAGTCRFYDQSDQNMQLNRLMQVKPKKKSAANRITSLQLSRGDSSQLIITSTDSKIRFSEGVDIIQKFQGPRNSKVLLPPSLTSDGRYLITAGMDSNVHIWNSDTLGNNSKSTKRPKPTIRSRETFFSEGVASVAHWPGLRQEGSNFCPSSCGETHGLGCCSSGTWFFADGMRDASATWPEESLLPSLNLKNINCCSVPDDCRSKASAAWNLVIVTGSRDGVIRFFHNYGLPVRL